MKKKHWVIENRKRTARWIKIISHHKTEGLYLLHVHTRLCTCLFRWQSWCRRLSYCFWTSFIDVVIFIEIFFRYDVNYLGETVYKYYILYSFSINNWHFSNKIHRNIKHVLVLLYNMLYLLFKRTQAYPSGFVINRHILRYIGYYMKW